ncbi:hypothetical protein NLJ89_g5773 [Agrocybe chaxingu]|uniref:Uncharacterized protein n=1 Tax=Agrocybe chaxingu TaxID=84603 RepID=A0A9W8K0E4_9AGAR|nr:hypothetical protein NLJ89_g5773 [Agrocybe chaxingu]
MADASRPRIGFFTPLSFTVGQRLDALAWSLGDSAPVHSQSYKASAMSTSKLTRRSAEDDSIKWPNAYIIELPQNLSDA